MTLHPFEDGNGRLARALTDMAICQDEQRPVRLFSLSAQIMSEQNAYYDSCAGFYCFSMAVRSEYANEVRTDGQATSDRWFGEDKQEIRNRSATACR
jgi:Fic family protein